MKIRLLVFLILPVISSCSDRINSDFISKFSLFFSIKTNENLYVLVIPVDASCSTCRDKVLNFVRYNNFNNLKVIISANSKFVTSEFINDFKLANKANIYLDNKNYCFLQDLVFMRPIIYKFEQGKLIQRIEIIPANVDRELLQLLEE